MVKKRVAVLGAGPMGLAVAYQLSKDGHAPEIFEAADHIGGMSAPFDFNGLTIERFYHFHCTSDTALFKILEELGISHTLNWVETKMGYWYLKQLQEWGNPIALLKFRGLGWIDKMRYGLHAFITVKRNDWVSLDKISATTWLKKWIGANAYDVLWRKLIEFKFYNYSDEVTAAWMWSRIRRIGRSRYNLFREQLGYIDGGSNTLLQALRQNIEKNGGTFRLSCPIDEVQVTDSKVVGVVVNSQLLKFDFVVSTIPIPYIPKIIPNLPKTLLQQYGELKNVAVVCVIVNLKKPVSDKFWVNINDPDMDIPGLIEYTNLYPLGNSHIVYAPYYMPEEHPMYQDSNNVFIEKVLSYIKTINPDIQDDDIVDAQASRYAKSQPLCTNDFLSKLPPINLPVKGLWVADTAYYYPEDRGISESVDLGRKIALEVDTF